MTNTIKAIREMGSTAIKDMRDAVDACHVDTIERYAYLSQLYRLIVVLTPITAS